MTRLFQQRHIGIYAPQLEAMLQQLGQDSLDHFIDQVVPQNIRRTSLMELPDAMNQHVALARIGEYAKANKVAVSLLGMGYHGTQVPPVIQRNVLENPAWYTAYTPYQPEISQGRLEALLNFQTMITDLTGMEIANASMLDEATAIAEAAMMAARLSKKGQRILVDQGVHPQTKEVLKTRFSGTDIELVYGRACDEGANLEALICAVMQYPCTQGGLRDIQAEIEAVHQAGGLAIVSADLLGLMLLKSPGEMGADIVVGSAQRFGVPMGFGGPHAAYFATLEKYQRSMPGRLVGISVDKTGQPALRLALQTREQHIRRDKATSNICTSQVLLANMAGFYAVWHGAEGLTTIARAVHAKACAFAKLAQQAGQKLRYNQFFDTIVIELGSTSSAMTTKLEKAGFLVRDLGDAVALSFDEAQTPKQLNALAEAMGYDAQSLELDPSSHSASITAPLQRQNKILEQKVFNSYRSETDMMRYLRALADKDLALDRTLIPLGSCTMKLNAAAEMMPVTWPEFGSLHPFAPKEHAQGYIAMIKELEQWLCACTGYAAVSLQPNAGSQGEFAGLRAIKQYHEAKGQGNRHICLIPASAHGTNPASAAMAGMKVVVVECDKHGNVSIDDLREKAEKYSTDLAALMITYPSTHGVFEEKIVDITGIIHDHGGQVYVDGANLNALVGLSSLPEFGADVSHLNLHKTFCIPHGGGGPGVGPVAVAAHLAPYLPKSPLLADSNAVSAAPFGSASILPITWMYIAMMGAKGLTDASKISICSANYIASKLEPHYPILYKGKSGFVAHECILDIRGIKEDCGISNEDIAKRLIDYGFHAPTMSFPVAGTLMVEPTESESLQEIDRFCDAMIAIKAEIDQVKSGQWPLEDNPLVNAPHTAQAVTASDWMHPYSRELAAFPQSTGFLNKYWPSVARVDNVFGDRNLQCSCLPLEAWREENS